jgi:RNA polymerase sigma-70 factor, ECF subfamily
VVNLDIQQVVGEYFARIHRAALVLTGNPWDADDLAQETFLAFSKSADRFEGRSSLYTWLYGIMLNLDRRERRRRGTQQTKLRVLWDNGSTAEQTTPAAETPIEVAQWKRSLWGYVAQLPDGQRHALVLRFSEHLSYEEIAEALDCPLGTVKSRIFHGLAALRNVMGDENSAARLVPRHPREDVNHAI